MKTLFKLKLILVLLAIGFLSSCKNNETVPADNYNNAVDSTQITTDSLGTSKDTTTVNPTNGTTGEQGTGSSTGTDTITGGN